MAELERWDGAGVVLTGCHGTFCSGADLSVVRSHMAEGPAGRAMCLLFGARPAAGRPQTFLVFRKLWPNV